MHYLGRLVSITITYSLLVVIVERAFTFLSQLYVSRLRQKTKKLHSIATPTVVPIEKVTPLKRFNYKAVEPIKYRPFESKRHVVMGVWMVKIDRWIRLTCRIGIKKSAREDWIRIDNGYLDRVTLRKRLLDEFPSTCMGDSSISTPAIRELYEEVMLDLLPRRYPSMFKISGDLFFNLITGSRHRISSTLRDSRAMLRQIGENVEEDFYFMVPNAQRGEFVLEGFVSCFPQGLLPPNKVGLSVSEIHEPVPGYEGRLKKGVNKCFERLEPGQSVGRVNVGFIRVSSTQIDALLTWHSGPSNATTTPYILLTTEPIP